jgi:hypothetical protein
MNAPVSQQQFTFISDGTALVLTVDLTLAPFNLNLAGNFPRGVIEPSVSSVATGPLTGVTASISGTLVTLTFATPPQEQDSGGNTIIYTASFLLQYGINPAYYMGVNWNVANVCTGTVGGGNRVFQLPGTPQGPVVIVVDGLLKTPGVDYTLVGTTVTMSTAPDSSPIAYY